MFIELIGWIAFFKILIEVAKIAFSAFSKVDYKAYGANEDSWAVITGASDGIGEEFALQLAEKGFNTIIIARREEKLKEIASKIEKTYNKKSKVITFDFSKGTNEDYKNLIEEIKKNNIRILINNVGMSYQYPKYFDELEESNIDQIVNVNVNSSLKLTHGLLKTLRDNAKDKSSRSVIVNVSSATSLIAAPLLAVYAGSKSFINSWSEAISSEYSSTKLDIVTLSPWFVSTNMSKKRPDITTPKPNLYVQQSLNTLTSSTFHGGFTVHSIMSYIASFIPVQLQKPAIKSFHANLRSRAMKKYATTQN